MIQITMPVTNTHTFSIGEKFNGQIDEEHMVIRGITANTVTFDYHAEGTQLSRRTIEKKTAREFIQYGYWKPTIENI
jgi:hypothetical protein